MSPTFDAFVRSWPWEPWLVGTLMLTAAIYVRGWRFLHRRDPARWSAARLAAFLGGLAALFLALASPIEPFAALFLQAHMVQHMLLMMVAPPLVWLGAPMFPLTRGLPRAIRSGWVAPLVRSRGVRRAFGRLTHPLVAWPLFVASTWLWHLPRGYELALSRTDWHMVEHACFVGTALVFWYPVVRPYPCRPRWSPWMLFPYLILADVQNTVLSAWLTFSNTPLYPHYSQVPRFGGSVLDDQAAAGVLMWVPGSIAFLLPLGWLGIRFFRGSDDVVRRGAWEPSPSGRGQGEGRSRFEDRPHPNPLPEGEGDVLRPRGRPVGKGVIGVSLPVVDLAREAGQRPVRRAQTSDKGIGWDLLRTPLVGRFLRWRYSRHLLQTCAGLLAIAMIVDGLRGPVASPMNLAGVLPWIHWRGLVVFGLLIGGNLSCMVCPFTLPRAAARRWLPAGFEWPRALRNKWLALGLLALFLFSYEAFALWDSPWLTAWIAIGYFVAAAVVDGFFRGAAFCKYVCPIGQFNFVQSLVSPLEVKVRDVAVCASCRTKECTRGTPDIPGCEMGLVLPRKTGNLDCTFCLDCVHVCPHENIGVLSVTPGHWLTTASTRTGLSTLRKRPDLAALVVVLAFGALANAAGMVGPVVQGLERWRVDLGRPPAMLVTGVYYLVAIALLPLVAISLATWASRALSRQTESAGSVAMRYVYALVPLGFSVWLAHYSFHLLTSYGTIVPVTQRFVADLGWSGLGAPAWQRACCTAVAAWIPRFEIVALDVGLLASLTIGYRIARAEHRNVAPQALRAFAPWAVLIGLFFAAGVWIVLQPMQMRGTMSITEPSVAEQPPADEYLANQPVRK